MVQTLSFKPCLPPNQLSETVKRSIACSIDISKQAASFQGGGQRLDIYTLRL